MRCGCRWTSAGRFVLAGDAIGGSGGRVEVRQGVRRQTLGGSSSYDVKRLNSGRTSWKASKKKTDTAASQ